MPSSKRSHGFLTGSASMRAVLLATVVVFAGCQTPKPRAHPEEVQQLIAQGPGPVTAKFKPIAPEERMDILGENGRMDYRIGNGDGLRITGDVDFLKNFGETAGGDVLPTIVKPDGNIYLPELGAVPTNGLTVIQLQDDLRERLIKYKKNPFVSVDVVEFKSQTFYVLGAVNQPGVYPVDGHMSLLATLALAGGASEQADLEQAYVVRDSKILPVSMADMIMRGDMSRNVTMRSKDLVFVPQREDAKVYVVGEVKSPGPVPFSRGRLTLAAAVAAAGGLDSVNADVNQVRIYRGGWDNPQVLAISSEDVYKFGEAIQLRSGDRVMVAPSNQATNLRAAQFVLPYINTALALLLTGLALDR
ncbi:MAG: polysaccharide export protein [Planctomycetota bacterium]|nr:polysaccharide export protein [Planctomycetota bacterium]